MTFPSQTTSPPPPPLVILCSKWLEGGLAVGSKCLAVGSKWFVVGSKWLKVARNWVAVARTGLQWFATARNCSKWLAVVNDDFYLHPPSLAYRSALRCKRFSLAIKNDCKLHTHTHTRTRASSVELQCVDVSQKDSII